MLFLDQLDLCWLDRQQNIFQSRTANVGQSNARKREGDDRLLLTSRESIQYHQRYCQSVFQTGFAPKVLEYLSPQLVIGSSEHQINFALTGS